MLPNLAEEEVIFAERVVAAQIQVLMVLSFCNGHSLSVIDGMEPIVECVLLARIALRRLLRVQTT